MFRQHLLAKVINFNLPLAHHPGAFKAEIEAAYAGEEGTESQGYCFSHLRKKSLPPQSHHGGVTLRSERPDYAHSSK